VQARATDCNDCEHSADQVSARSYVQCQNSLSSRDKQVAPALAETCTGFVYTTTYVFAPTFTVTPTWQGMIYTDELPYQAYLPGSAAIQLQDGQSCGAVFSETVSNGMLVLTNISPTCDLDVAGTTMVINYSSAITAPAGCDDLTVYDWSYLNLGVTGNESCADDGVLEEGVYVTADAPQMALGVLGAPANVEPCAEYPLTLTLTRLDGAPAYDVAMGFDTTDYALVEVLGFDGVTPAYTATAPLSYTWFYSDSFAAATNASVRLFVQRRCDATGPIEAQAWYEGLCEDDDEYFEECHVSGGANPPVLQPSLIVAKYPEVYWAEGDFVTWTLTLINAGAAVAHDVVLTDTLGPGLRYVASTITATRGSVAGVTPVVDGGLITWTLQEVASGAQVKIRLTAEVVDCEGLTNAFSGYQSCQGQVCQYRGPKSSLVELPETILINTNVGISPLNVCTTGTVTITVKNAGLMSVYSATLRDILPESLVYLSGTAEFSTDLLTWQPGPDPSISEQTLSWGPGSGMGLGSLLQRVAPDQTVYIRYQVRADCDYNGGLLRIQTQYYDVCDLPYQTAESTYAMEATRAELSITKQGQNLTTGDPLADLVRAEPGETVLWQISLTNEGDGTAYQTWVTDTLPWNANFVTATLPVVGPDASGTLTWFVDTLAPGASRVFTASTEIVDPDGCDEADTVNVAAASWGCPTGCRSPWQAATGMLRTRPLYRAAGLTASPTSLYLCQDELTIYLDNEGTPAYDVVLTATLPGGLVYSETVSISTTADTNPSPGDNPAVWRWASGSLPTGQTAIRIRVRNDASAGDCAAWSGPLVLQVAYDDHSVCPSTDRYETTHSIPLTRLYPLLAVDKQPTTQIADVGQRVTWTVLITNTGSAVATGLRVTDVVASNYTNVTASAGSDGAPAVVEGRTITWTPSDLAASGGAWSAQVSADLVSSGVNRNVVTATTYCALGCAAASDSNTAHVTLVEAFDKNPPIQTGTIGSLAVFTFNVSLSDHDALYERLTLTDVLPAGLGYAGAVLTYTYDAEGAGATTQVSTTPSSAPALYQTDDVVWELGDLPGTVQVSGILTAVIRNHATCFDGARLPNLLQMTYTDDGQPYSRSDTVHVDVEEPILHLGKSYRTAEPCDATLAIDDFNDLNDAGWSELGSWSVSADGVYQNTTSMSYRRAFTGDAGWTDYSFSFMMRSSDPSGGMGGYVRQTGGGTTDSGYVLRWTNTRLELRQRNPDQLLGTFPGGYEIGRWYHVEMRVQGDLIEVFVDGVLRLSATDTTHSAGRVGLLSYYHSQTQFDDVLVTRLGGAGCLAGAGDLVTYTLTISNQRRLTAYDLLVTDALPTGMSLVTYTMSSDDPAAQVETGPAPGATGTLSWSIDQLAAQGSFDPTDHSALTLDVVLRVDSAITASVTLPNQAALSYDNWEDESQPAGIDRDSSGGTHSTAVRTAEGGVAKFVEGSNTYTATIGTTYVYSLVVPPAPIPATLYDVAVVDVVDSRLAIEGVSTSGGVGPASGFSGQLITATFDSVARHTQAVVWITTTVRNLPVVITDGTLITDRATLAHSAGGPQTSNVVTTTILLGSIGDYVWLDLNQDGRQGAGETPIPGVIVDLYDSGSGAHLGSDITDASGLYQFDDLPLEVGYTVQLSQANFLPGGALHSYTPTLYLGGTPFDNTDSNANPGALFNGSGYAVSTTLTFAAVDDLTLDFGFFSTFSLGDMVWHDWNNNGVYEPGLGESGVDDVTVELYRAGDVPSTTLPLSSTVTSGGGRFLFTNLDQGGYFLHIPPGEFASGQELEDFESSVPTEPNPNTDQNEDVDENGFPVSGGAAATAGVSSGVVTLTVNGEPLGDDVALIDLTPDADSNLTVDFGFFLPSDLELVKTVTPDAAAPNQPVTYTLHVTNDGLAILTPLVLTDTLPAGFSYVTGSGDPADPDTVAEPLLVWDDLGPLEPGQGLTVTFVVTAAPGLSGTRVNTATAAGHHLGGVLTRTDSVPLQVLTPALAVDKEIIAIDRDILYPNFVTCTIVISNAGPSALDLLPLVDDYNPFYLSFERATPAPDAVDSLNGLLAWNDLTGVPNGFDRNLSPSGSFIITTVFRVAHDIDVTTTNFATVTNAVDIYGNPANEDEDLVYIWIEGNPGIPTPVEVISFTATTEEGQVRLAWTTAAELGITHFHIYRASGSDFAAAEIIATVPASGPDSSYVYEDRDVTWGQYWYWLVEEVSSGNPDTYGPAQAGVGIDMLSYHLYLPLVVRR